MSNNRNTIQKTIVYEAALALLGSHPDASKLYEYIHQHYPKISRGTVYRNLGVMCEEGKLIKIPMEDGAHCYDVNLSHHAHFYCQQCHQVTDLELEDLQFSHLETQGYEVKKQTIILNGICPKCKEEMENERIKGNKN